MSYKTVFSGPIERACWQAEYMSLDCFSDTARKSLLYFLYKKALPYVDSPSKVWDLNVLLDARARNYLVNELKAHGMAGILTQEWREFFVAEFWTKVTEYTWDAIYYDNEVFDERKAREARLAGRTNV